MPRTLVGLAALALALAPARGDSPPPTSPGRLDVFDEAKLFSPDGVTRAKEKFRETTFHHGLTVTVDTVAEPPAARKKAAEEASHDKGKWRAFMLDWARETAGADHAKGVYVLVTLKPVGGVAVVADKQTAQRGFSATDDGKVRDILAAAFHDAAAEKDAAKAQDARAAGLLKAVEAVAADLKDTRVAEAPAGNGKAHRDGPAHANPPRQGNGIMGYVCLGLAGLAGVWLVIGLFRMFTGGGGGGGPGMGGGGGGGGFFTSLLGGLFGAAAGMWMYNHMFGGGGMFGGGPDAYAGDAGSAGDAGGGDADPGAGDWGGGSGAAGGFDDGGGDFGGGGGDFGGGGGDFGGDF